MRAMRVQHVCVLPAKKQQKPKKELNLLPVYPSCLSSSTACH
jgi:hypothetical protein